MVDGRRDKEEDGRIRSWRALYVVAIVVMMGVIIIIMIMMGVVPITSGSVHSAARLFCLNSSFLNVHWRLIEREGMGDAGEKMLNIQHDRWTRMRTIGERKIKET